MKLILFMNYDFSKKLACVSLCHKDLKTFAHESKSSKISLNTSADNSLEINLNVIKCLIVSFVSLKVLL